MTDTVDLNVDAGESFGAWSIGDDAALFRTVTSANLACGFHAGDPATIADAVELALSEGVAIGAHPGLPDRVGFGRRALALTPREAYADVLYQIGAIAGFLRATGSPLHHAKMHGALSTDVAEADAAVADAIVRAVRAFDASLPLVVIPGSRLAAAAGRLGQPAVAEGFPDRGYAPDGSLARRGSEGALVHDPEVAAARAVRMLTAGTVEAIDGTLIPLAPATLCIHGDGPNAAAIARAVRTAVEAAGIAVAAF